MSSGCKMLCIVRGGYIWYLNTWIWTWKSTWTPALILLKILIWSKYGEVFVHVSSQVDTIMKFLFWEEFWMLVSIGIFQMSKDYACGRMCCHFKIFPLYIWYYWIADVHNYGCCREKCRTKAWVWIAYLLVSNPAGCCLLPFTQGSTSGSKATKPTDWQMHECIEACWLWTGRSI